MLIYYILFFVFVVFAVLDDNLTVKSKSQIIILSGIIMIFFAGLRGDHVDIDYKTYHSFFKQVPTINYLLINPSSFFKALRIEPSFILIFSFVKTFFYNGFPIAIFLYAILGVTVKLKAIGKLTDLILLSTLIYFTNIFLLQDMNQIRVGVAIGFLFLSIIYIEEKNFIKFIIFVLLAIFFHYASIAFLPLYFLNTKNINKTAYTLLILIPILLCLLKFDPYSFLIKFDLGIVTEKIKTYLEIQKYKKESINLFNFSIIGQILFSLFFIFFGEKAENKYAILLTKINCFSVVCFYTLSASPVIAFRLSELFSSVQIILIPLMIYVIKPKALAEFIVIVISLAYFLNLVLINKIFEKYTTIL